MPDWKTHESPAHEPAALPVMVPPRLIGRDAVIGKIYTRLRENVPLQLTGTPGVGKTTLAATLAAAYTEQPGGVLWLNADHSSLEELIVRVGRAYGVREITSSENPLGMVGAVAATLTQHKPLVVLDGALDEATATAFIERCVRGLPVMLIAPKAVNEAWTTFHLENLEAGHAAVLFKQTAGLPESPDPDVDRLVQMLQFSPFALVIAASTMRTAKQQPVQYINALTQIPGYATADPVLVALTAAFRSLNSALQGVLLMLGATFKGQASAEFLSMLTGAPKETIQQVMTLLTQQHLVETTQRYGEPYYHLHTVTYAFAQSWLRGSQRLGELQNKVRDSALAYARQYAQADQEAAHDKLAAEMDTLMSVAQWAADQEDRDTPRQFIVALTAAGDFVNGRGYVYELLRLNRLASSTMTAFPAYPPETRILPDEEDEEEESVRPAAPPAFLREMFASEEDDDDLTYDEADDDLEDEDEDVEEIEESLFTPAPRTYLIDEDDDEGIEEDDLDEDGFDEDDPDEDMLEAAPGHSAVEHTYIPEMPPPSGIVAWRTELAQARQQSDMRRQGDLLKRIGAAQVESGMHNEAIATYGEALTVYDELGEEEELLQILDTLSTLMVKTDNSQAAILHATRGAQLADKLGDDETRMHILVTLGDARQQLGESVGAEKAYSQALEIARNTGDSQNEALVLYKLGYAQLDNSDPEAASANWEQALPLFREQGKREYEGRVMGGLGTAYAELSRWSEAISFYTSALYIAREVKDRDEEALQLGTLGYANMQTGQLGEAVLRYRQALHLAYENGRRENAVSIIVDLARLLLRSPRYLSVVQLLVDDALRLEPNDRDVRSLKERVTNELLAGEANGIQQAPVNGTAQTYAANAYALLDP